MKTEHVAAVTNNDNSNSRTAAVGYYDNEMAARFCAISAM